MFADTVQFIYNNWDIIYTAGSFIFDLINSTGTINLDSLL
jgi:hypothetical protein